jgi:hypothetical protein
MKHSSPVRVPLKVILALPGIDYVAGTAHENVGQRAIQRELKAWQLMERDRHFWLLGVEKRAHCSC